MGMAEDRLFRQADGESSGRVGVRFGAYDEDYLWIGPEKWAENFVYDTRSHAGQYKYSLDLYGPSARSSLDEVIRHRMPRTRAGSKEEREFGMYAGRYGETSPAISYSPQMLMSYFQSHGAKVDDIDAVKDHEHIFVIHSSGKSDWMIKMGIKGDDQGNLLAWFNELRITQLMKNVDAESVVANDPIGFLKMIGLESVANELETAYAQNRWRDVVKIMNTYFIIDGHVFMTTAQVAALTSASSQRSPRRMSPP